MAELAIDLRAKFRCHFQFLVFLTGDESSHRFLQNSLSSLGEKPFSESGYNSARSQLENVRVGELIAPETGGVVRLRSGSQLTTRVLYGNDPLKAVIEEMNLTIQFIGVEADRPIVFATASGRQRANSDVASAAHRYFCSIFGTENLKTVLRSDEWFHVWMPFPILNPFVEPVDRPPSIKEYRASPTFVCYPGLDGKQACRVD